MESDLIRIKIQELENSLLEKNKEIQSLKVVLEKIENSKKKGLTTNESWRNELTKAGTPRKVPPRVRGPKWEPKKVEHTYHIVSQEVYQQLIRELAEILYKKFKEIQSKS